MFKFLVHIHTSLSTYLIRQIARDLVVTGAHGAFVLASHRLVLDFCLMCMRIEYTRVNIFACTLMALYLTFSDVYAHRYVYIYIHMYSHIYVNTNIHV